jgi:hypothetical protein
MINLPGRARFLRVPALALAIVACALPAAAALADDDDESGSGRVNIATATAQRDGGAEFAFAWSLDRPRGGAVDHVNEARATASCTNCRATAIAFQIVLASGPTTSVTPRNLAVALNENCTGCVAYAGARQFVRVTDRPVRLTPRGRQTLAGVRAALRDLKGDPLSAAELEARVDAETARVRQVLADELVPASGGGSPRTLDEDDREADDG